MVLWVKCGSLQKVTLEEGHILAGVTILMIRHLKSYDSKRLHLFQHWLTKVCKGQGVSYFYTPLPHFLSEYKSNFALCDWNKCFRNWVLTLSSGWAPSIPHWWIVPSEPSGTGINPPVTPPIGPAPQSQVSSRRGATSYKGKQNIGTFKSFGNNVTWQLSEMLWGKYNIFSSNGKSNRKQN